MENKKIKCKVNSHNEWDPLEEVIIGNLKNSMFPIWNDINAASLGKEEWVEVEKKVGGAGIPYPKELVENAQKDLNEFIHILKSEGVIVREVDDVDYSRSFSTPDWSNDCGFCAADPRDPFLVIGNEIIETPMPDRNRYFESLGYKSLFKEYFKSGAKWTSAPKPALTDELYKKDYILDESSKNIEFALTEFEPVFDAADFVRCGKDIFCQQSHVTNRFGIDWLERHLGDTYRVHEVKSTTSTAYHIDTTFMPLAPGKVLVNPKYLDVNNLPDVLKSWDILVSPETKPHGCPLGVLSDWISINVLMLDEKRIVVERKQEALIKKLKDWGFEPILCSFESYYPFLGSFHCSTLDIRRDGELKSYF